MTRHVEQPGPPCTGTVATELVAAARKAGVTLAVGYCRRFHPSVVDVRTRLKDGRLGHVISMVAQHTTSTGQFIAPDNWRAAPEEAANAQRSGCDSSVASRAGGWRHRSRLRPAAPR